ncbi:MAG: polysaccharide deacetylase family protein [Pseudomonadota bacterium]
MARLRYCKENIKRSLLHQLQRVLYVTGCTRLHNHMVRPEGAIILMYHSIVDDNIAPFIHPGYSISMSVFEQQMQLLKNQYNVIDMASLVKKIDNNEKISAKTVVITFDDGYLNNLQIAAPILEKYQLPATLFLCTAYVSRAESQWVDQLHSMLQFRSCEKINWQDNSSFNLQKDNDFCAFFSLISSQLLIAETEQRKQLLSQLWDKLQPTREIPKLTMNWDGVRDLKQRYPLFELALHTHEHMDLTRLSSTQLEQELLDCIQTFEQQLGFKAQFFSYPYGRYNPYIVKKIEQLGLKSAVITGPTEAITAKTNKFMLSRYEVTDSMLDLKLWLSGSFPKLPRLLFKRVYP